jgi:hypothetical protein
MIVSSSALVASGSAAIDDAHDVGFLHDHQLLAIDLDLGPRPLAEEDAIAGLDIERVNLAVLAASPAPTAMTSPSMGFSWAVSGMMIPPVVFASCRLRFLFDAPHKHAVVQRSEIMRNSVSKRLNMANLRRESAKNTGISLNAEISTLLQEF